MRRPFLEAACGVGYAVLTPHSITVTHNNNSKTRSQKWGTDYLAGPQTTGSTPRSTPTRIARVIRDSPGRGEWWSNQGRKLCCRDVGRGSVGTGGTQLCPLAWTAVYTTPVLVGAFWGQAAMLWPCAAPPPPHRQHTAHICSGFPSGSRHKMYEDNFRVPGLSRI